MKGTIDHERIRDTEDRSWTFPLLEVALSPSTSDDDRDEAFQSLAYLEDHRSVAPLTAVVEDLRGPESVRDEASAVVRGFDDTSTSAQRRAWWGTGDPVLAVHALGLMTRREADIVTAVAGDDNHPLQAFALGSMAFGYDEPQFQPVRIRALGHPDPRVRRAAADVLLWDEPAAAEEALLRAAEDPVAEVAEAAVDTLQYYASQRVLRAVSGLLDAPDKAVRSKAAESFESLRGSFEAMVTEGDPAEVKLLREWMEPVRDLVRWPDEIRQREWGGPPTRPTRNPVSEQELRVLVADPDGEWKRRKDRLRKVDWSAFEPDERARLASVLAGHPDPVVREIACAALSEWERSEELLALTGDASFGVRKMAMYHLGLVSPDRALAEPAWAYMASEKGTTAYEALATYVAHAPTVEAEGRLADLARTDRREAVVTRAISLLAGLAARAEVAGLLPMLDDQPGVTWAVHIALLDAIRKLGLAHPPLDHLAAVDNLHLVRAVVAVQCPAR